MEGSDPQPPQPQGLQITIEPAKRAGVWANWAQVSHTEHEFTIDFVRLDPVVPTTGIVVARVAVSPLFVTQLVDALNSNWSNYADKAMPREVQDAGSTADDQPEDEPEGGEPNAEDS